MFSFSLKAGAALLAISPLVSGITLDTSSPNSIKNVSAAIAYNMMTYYANNATNTSTTDVGTFGRPYYWWESATVWGALIDYSAYTNDTSYNPTVSQGLLAQVGPNNDYMPPAQTKDLGNDDQAYWALSCMDALEYGLPSPSSGEPTWLELAVNVWNDQAARWNTESCAGGLKWQIFSFNAGYDYKNANSNGAFFQLSARLAHYTGNQTYVTWAGKTWDWMSAVGLVSSDGAVYDGTDDITNCSSVNHIEWTANSGLMLYGASVLYNVTGSSAWNDRITAILDHAKTTFFTSDGVMTEIACESNTPVNCNNDQIAFKGLFARWMAKTAIMTPSVKSDITSLLQTSAKGAAASCSGGDDQTSCGELWYGSYRANGTYSIYDENTGLGQEMAALSVIQSLLLLNGDVDITKAQTYTQNSTVASTTSGSSGSNSSSNTTTGPASSSSPARNTNDAGMQVFSMTLLVLVMACTILLLA